MASYPIDKGPIHHIAAQKPPNSAQHLRTYAICKEKEDIGPRSRIKNAEFSHAATHI